MEFEIIKLFLEYGGVAGLMTGILLYLIKWIKDLIKEKDELTKKIIENTTRMIDQNSKIIIAMEKMTEKCQETHNYIKNVKKE
jgi:adenylosuccinate synthase